MHKDLSLLTVRKRLVFPHAGCDGCALLNCLRWEKNADQKKALLLHTAGLNVQDTSFTLNEEEG